MTIDNQKKILIHNVYVLRIYSKKSKPSSASIFFDNFLLFVRSLPNMTLLLGFTIATSGGCCKNGRPP